MPAGQIDLPRPFTKQDRVVQQADFDRVHQSDVFAADELLVVKASPNPLQRTRLGVSISRRVGNAVVRNRWKRLIREAFRRQLEHLPPGIDIVVRPRRGAKLEMRRAQLSKVESSLLGCCKRLQRKLDRPR